MPQSVAPEGGFCDSECSLTEEALASGKREKAMRIWVLAAALVCLNSPGSAAGELTGTLKHIADTGVIHLGFREAEPPMSFLNKSGQPIC